MQTYLIVSPNSDATDHKIESLKKRVNPSKFNIHEITALPSIGITETRKIKEIIGKKTFMGGNRMIIIKEIEKATPEAANSLLKILEEPPENTYIILTAQNINGVLPTIVSRSEIFSIMPSGDNKSSKLISDNILLLKQLLTSSPSKRLMISQNTAKNKEQALIFLDGLIKTFSHLLNHQDSNLCLSNIETASLIQKVISARGYLQKNVNPKATLDILFLGFPYCKIS